MTHARRFQLPLYLVALSLLLLLTSIGYAKGSRLVRQTTSSDCGPAALATLLTFYLDIPATEAEIVKLAEANPESGTSLLGLEKAVEIKGGGSESLRMNFETLQRQLASYPAPVIVRLLLPEPHFVLVLKAGDDVAVSDPAAGHVWMKKKAFLKRWLIEGSKDLDGYVFIAARADGEVNKANLKLTLNELDRSRLALQQTRPILPFPNR